MLMGVAEVLASMRKDLPGTVLFVFQPAEEGAPPGEGRRGADAQGGHLRHVKPEVVFGLHVWSSLQHRHDRLPQRPVHGRRRIAYRIVVNGKQTHGSRPWQGVDPIVVAAQIVNALQTVVSRQIDITRTRRW